MKPFLAQFAAQNNAAWCDAVCCAHGVPGEFLPAVWLNRHPAPPYYSNLVVTADAQPASNTIDSIRALMKLALPQHWTVKDSFGELELAAEGFDVLFNASWIGAEPASLASQNLSPSLRWSRATSSAELLNWEAAWLGGARNAKSAGQPAQFPVSLLIDPQIVFFAGCHGDEIVAGGIAHSAKGVVGLSNFFAHGGDAEAAWPSFANAANAAFPHLPLVGYERDAALTVALAAGFEALGSLRVWMRRS